MNRNIYLTECVHCQTFRDVVLAVSSIVCPVEREQKHYTVISNYLTETEGGVWEETEVASVIRAMRTYSDAVFVGTKDTYRPRGSHFIYRRGL